MTEPDMDELDPAPEPPAPHVVLLVEDEVLVRFALAEHLRGQGYVVLECASADETRQVFAAGVEVDVVLSDINMPKPRDGIDLALWLATSFSAVPVLLTSGDQHALQAAAAACSDVKGFIFKPYNHETVERRIHELVTRRKRGAG